MKKINWELKLDGVVDFDELDHIAERIKTGALEGTVFVDLDEDPADRDDRLYHEEQDHIAMGIIKENK